MNYARLSTSSTKQIKIIMLSDYKKQLEQLQAAHKQAKAKKQETKQHYLQYRKNYLLLKNRILATTKALNK